MQELFIRLLEVRGLSGLYQPEALLYLLVVVGLLWLGKQAYSLSVPYNLLTTIAHDDNKAATVSFAGFMFGLGLVLWGALTAHGLPELGSDLLDMALVGATGIVLLIAGQMLTDRAIYRSFVLRDELARGNLAAGVAEAGGFIATGLIVKQAVAIDGATFLVRLVDSLVFFVLAQCCFVVFAAVRHRVAGYHVQEQLKQGNPAVGLSLGLTFVAMGNVLAYAIGETGSIVVFGGWFLLSSVLLVAFRVFVDRALLPGHSLDDELGRDQNWGVALLEGGLAVVMSLVLTGAF
jgi:uncharacterized membrane protein YjfL (UPF0719 family)